MTRTPRPEIEPADLDLLRALVPILEGIRGFAWHLADKLAPLASAVSESAEPQDESSEDFPELLGADLRCIVIDTLDPAIQRLETLIEELAPRPGSPA